jgi:hypothetical protein
MKFATDLRKEEIHGHLDNVIVTRQLLRQH